MLDSNLTKKLKNSKIVLLKSHLSQSKTVEKVSITSYLRLKSIALLNNLCLEIHIQIHKCVTNPFELEVAS